jgi:hypothetical protein
VDQVDPDSDPQHCLKARCAQPASHLICCNGPQRLGRLMTHNHLPGRVLYKEQYENPEPASAKNQITTSMTQRQNGKIPAEQYGPRKKVNLHLGTDPD